MIFEILNFNENEWKIGHFLIDHRAKKEKLEITYSELSERQLKIKDEWDQVIEMAGRQTMNRKKAKKRIHTEPIILPAPATRTMMTAAVSPAQRKRKKVKSKYCCFTKCKSNSTSGVSFKRIQCVPKPYRLNTALIIVRCHY